TLREIVEEYHGRLDVLQTPTGTTYTMALPVRAVAPHVPERPAWDAAAGTAAVAGRRLLVVDDDEDGRDMLSELLAAYGANVDAFGTGREALEYLRGRPREDWPDLMICDIGLPDEDGYAVLRRVRVLESEHHLP